VQNGTAGAGGLPNRHNLQVWRSSCKPLSNSDLAIRARFLGRRCGRLLGGGLLSGRGRLLGLRRYGTAASPVNPWRWRASLALARVGILAGSDARSYAAFSPRPVLGRGGKGGCAWASSLLWDGC